MKISHKKNLKFPQIIAYNYKQNRWKIIVKFLSKQARKRRRQQDFL